MDNASYHCKLVSTYFQLFVYKPISLHDPYLFLRAMTFPGKIIKIGVNPNYLPGWLKRMFSWKIGTYFENQIGLHEKELISSDGTNYVWYLLIQITKRWSHLSLFNFQVCLIICKMVFDPSLSILKPLVWRLNIIHENFRFYTVNELWSIITPMIETAEVYNAERIMRKYNVRCLRLPP